MFPTAGPTLIHLQKQYTGIFSCSCRALYPNRRCVGSNMVHTAVKHICKPALAMMSLMTLTTIITGEVSMSLVFFPHVDLFCIG